MEMSDSDILVLIREMVEFERFQNERFLRGWFVLFWLCFAKVCFAFFLSRSRKRKYRFVALPEQFGH